GPVEPEVKRIAASASAAGAGSSARWSVRDSAGRLVSTENRRERTGASGLTEIRLPGQPYARAGAGPGSPPMTPRGSAEVIARVIPRGPSPASATTATAPIFRQA